LDLYFTIAFLDAGNSTKSPKDAADYITKLPKQESDCRNGKRRD